MLRRKKNVKETGIVLRKSQKNQLVSLRVLITVICTISFVINPLTLVKSEGTQIDLGDIVDTINQPGPITDSWEEIIAASKDGTYTKKYKIGDTKELDLGKEGIINMQLVAMDADELADGSGKAHMTWIAVELLETSHVINEEKWTLTSDWPESDMRAWLRESILPLFPDILRSNIKEVTKYSYSYHDTAAVPSEDMIWIPSIREVFGGDSLTANNGVTYPYEDHGPEYTSVFSNDKSRKKHQVGASKASFWVLRTEWSEMDNFFFCCDNNNGSWKLTKGDSEHGVVLGFCL